MAVRKDNKKWVVDVQPGGRGHARVRRWFDTKADAVGFERWVRARASAGEPWQPKAKDRRRLSELVEAWYELHGEQLRDGKSRRSILLAVCKRMGDPVAGKMTPRRFTEYRTERLAAGVSPSTVNRQQAYLSSVFNKLKRLGDWSGENPISGVRRLRVHETELSWLDHDEIDQSVGCADPRAQP